MDKDRAREFYFFENRYFVSTDQNDANPGKIWEIVLAEKRIKESNMNIKLQAKRLKELADY
jgi:hypothetical protein